MGVFQKLSDLIRKLSEDGVDLDQVAIDEDDLWYQGEDDEENNQD